MDMELKLKRSQLNRANALIELYSDRISELRHDADSSCSSSEWYYEDIDKKINKLYHFKSKVQIIKDELCEEIERIVPEKW